MKSLPLLLLLASCAGSPYYAKVGIGYKIDELTDPLLRTSSVGGKNPTAHFEVGREWDRGYSCGLNHWSHWLSGGPLNNNPETYKLELLCEKKWGGSE